MKLQIGDRAPAFSAKDQDGNTVRLSDFEGKKVILYFYPKDNTPTCTVQACDLRDHYPTFKKKGYVLLGVSVDTEKSHQRFIAKHQLPFPLLADPEHVMVNDYGVWVEKTTFGRTYMGTARTTFLINEKGVIEQIIDKVESKHHSDQIFNKSEQ